MQFPPNHFCIISCKEKHFGNYRDKALPPWYNRNTKKSGKTADFSRFTNTNKEAPSMFLRNVESTWGNIFQMNLLDKLVFPYAIPAREMAELNDLVPQEENFYRTEDFLR